MKRILSVVLLLAMLASLLPYIPTPAKAVTRWEVINTSNVTGQDIADCARSYIGAGRYDGSNYKERTGFGSRLWFDCSGFVYRVYRDMNLGSPRKNATVGQYDHDGNPLEGKNSAGYYYITAHTQEQRYYGTQLSSAVTKYKQTGDYSGFEPGDLMVFSYNGGASVSHVAIYVGNGRVVHSTSSKGVAETALSQTGWPNGRLGNSLIDAARMVTHKHSYNGLGECAECGTEYDYEDKLTTASAGYYTVSAGSGIYLREKPYTDAAKLSVLITNNTEVEVLGEVPNASGETWYQVKYNGVTGYTAKSNLSFLRYLPQDIQCDLKTPTEGASIPQASYNLTGSITSRYPLAVVTAYVDDSLVTSISLGEATTLDIKSSAINQKLSFKNLTPGVHTLTILARDIHRDSLVTVCERTFYTVCSHNYTSVTTKEATCEADGLLTYTCSKCSDSYTESIPGGHIYENKVCQRCGEAEPEKVMKITCDLTSPAEGAVVPKATYNVLGQIVSDYPLSVVEAYLDGECFAVEELGAVTTLDIRTSAINKKLSFSKLESGPHTLVIKARDIYHDELITVCTRRFITEGEYECEHTYEGTVTIAPTCLEDGVKTYTCTLCGNAYTESIPGGHNYEDGVCTVCGEPEFDQAMEITCILETPGENEIVPKASYNVTGQIQSRYPLSVVEAYLDGECFAVEELGAVTTLDIRTSAINKKLSFSKLESGPHTLVIKAVDIYHDELITVCTRNFITEGEYECQHTYKPTVTEEPTCTKEGVLTFTCTACGDFYTETLDAGHYYEDGVCEVCGDPEMIISCEVSQPLEGATVPKASYNLLGTITSVNPLAFVEAYIDGACYASIFVGDSTTLDIRSSDINKKLSFSKLPSGTHTLEIMACDMYHEEMIPIISRTFVTAGTVSCSHNYVSTVTIEPSCFQTGTMTYRCSRCSTSYSVTMAARHNFVGGMCLGCGLVGSYDLTLSGDTEVFLNLSDDLYVDLAGYEMTGTIITNGYRVFGMDSATDGYSEMNMGYFNCEDEYGETIVPEAITTTRDMVRYMTVLTDEGYTFHRFYLGITHLNLVPDTTGFGYKAQFRGDAMVQSCVASVSYDLWVTESAVVSRTLDGFKDQYSLHLNNVDPEKYGETPVFARVRMTLTDGTVVEGAVHSVTLRDLVEAVALVADNLTPAQLSAMRAMIAKYPVMQSWYLDTLA